MGAKSSVSASTSQSREISFSESHSNSGANGNGLVVAGASGGGVDSYSSSSSSPLDVSANSLAVGSSVHQRSNSASEPGERTPLRTFCVRPRAHTHYPRVHHRSHHAASLGLFSAVQGAAYRAGLVDSDSSPDEDEASGLNRFFQTHGHGMSQSLPVHLFSLTDLKCPVCNKMMPSDDIECHLVMCLTKPRINYNVDSLQLDSGECVICLDDLTSGQTIARLPCLCIYHKHCIDEWFQVNRSCPEHPSD
ncbi:PREDICTED: E3 ubiquitin-protein ligase ZNRF2-like [Priapulus caudatus]|uniref:RING-type E3 ubiquitin transferase n=1 Tax=Priapulus caudatus TaxID=37621 RepID=A0ABM1EGV0_PRICU|nr:PREDICTED: E3 ubiquitin-protein ligase ZNRF2-like [Priapulus caudatus]XP_014671421.1 PREDICTED: E3 ubiquitin-protein ligase ZNRF2-like [Priapulus caudatus]